MERTHNQSALLNFLTCLLIAASALSLGCHEADKALLGGGGGGGGRSNKKGIGILGSYFLDKS